LTRGQKRRIRLFLRADPIRISGLGRSDIDRSFYPFFLVKAFAQNIFGIPAKGTTHFSDETSKVSRLLQTKTVKAQQL
jgi:hypothetical protein